MKALRIRNSRDQSLHRILSVLTLVCATPAMAAPCIEKSEGFLFVQVERAGALHEFGVGSNDPRVSFVPGLKDIKTIAACENCAGEDRLLVGISLSAVGETTSAAGADGALKLAVARLRQRGFPIDGLKASGVRAELRLEGIPGAATHFHDAQAKGPRTEFVVFGAANECVVVTGVITVTPETVQEDAFKGVISMIEAFRLREVPVGAMASHYPADRLRPKLPSTPSDAPPAPFSMDDIRSLKQPPPH